MTDLEMVHDLLTTLKIPFTAEIKVGRIFMRIEAETGDGLVGGYLGFYVKWVFDLNGSFYQMVIAE